MTKINIFEKNKHFPHFWINMQTEYLDLFIQTIALKNQVKCIVDIKNISIFKMYAYVTYFLEKKHLKRYKHCVRILLQYG